MDDKNMPTLPVGEVREVEPGLFVKQPFSDEQYHAYAQQYAEQRVAEFAQSIINEIPGGSIVDPQWVCDLLRQRSKQ